MGSLRLWNSGKSAGERSKQRQHGKPVRTLKRRSRVINHWEWAGSATERLWLKQLVSDHNLFLHAVLCHFYPVAIVLHVSVDMATLLWTHIVETHISEKKSSSLTYTNDLISIIIDGGKCKCLVGEISGYPVKLHTLAASIFAQVGLSQLPFKYTNLLQQPLSAESEYFFFMTDSFIF